MIQTILNFVRRWHVTTLKPFAKPSTQDLRLSLGDTNPTVATALASAFGGVNDVEVVEGDLLSLSSDAIVSPANSFGDMGGGIDKAIDDFHQGEAQRLLMEAIEEKYYGELPVGVALIVVFSISTSNMIRDTSPGSRSR